MFIVIEGIDGSGKSTQAKRLAEWLESRTGHETIHTYEPGGWPGGESFRENLLNAGKCCALTELLMFLADRSEHVNRVILPAIISGKNIICERYNASTLAYQCGGHKMSLDDARRIISSCKFPEPDMNIILDISPELAVSRIKSRTKSDRYESEGLSLMRKVSEYYRLIALGDRDKFTVIQCDNMTEDEVFTAIKACLEVKIWQSR